MKKSLLLSIVLMFVFIVIGCGDSHTDKNSMTNSEGKTKLGYFGKDVTIGEHKGYRYWKIVLSKKHNKFMEMNILNKNNLATLQDTKSVNAITYGVSNDGMIIRIGKEDGSPTMKVEILSKITTNTYKANLSSTVNSMRNIIVELQTTL